jgi:hypothetical protein
MRRLYTVLAFLTVSSTVWAQKPMHIEIKEPVICYASEQDNHFHVPPPDEYLKWKSNPLAKSNAPNATFVVEYIGFESAPTGAKEAFDEAVRIWSTLITSSVPIKIQAQWAALGSNVLGSAIYTAAYANFKGAQKLNVYYPVAIAEKITGENLNGDDPDIFARFSSNTNWNFNFMTPPSSGQFDFTTVVLHEIGHGLGFAGTFSVSGTNGQYGLSGSGVPIVYDVPIENGSDVNLIAGFASPSAAMRTQLIGNNLFFDTPTSSRPKLYAPSTFDQGSSISHLDEQTYGSNNSNALMTPQIAPVERIHNPGIALNMLKDLEWETIVIDHQPLPNTEDSTTHFLVKAVIKADVTYLANSVKLFYSQNDGGTYQETLMTPTGNANEFSAEIPATGVKQFYRYYISVNKNSFLQYTNPGKIIQRNGPQIQFYHRFEAGPDNKGPVIKHTPKLFVISTDTELKVDAVVSDNISVSSVNIEYRINEGTPSFQTMTLTNADDSIYSATLALGTLSESDVVKYKITATDNAVNNNNGPNQSILPVIDFFEVNVVALKPTQDSYANDFNNPSDDFFGNGFSITQPSGFASAAIHTLHPYQEGEPFDGDTIVYVYQLKIPIKVKALDGLIRFDEIVLVEPGESGSVFGSSSFYDYVVVEGSIDGGVTWSPVANGYDSRANSAWLSKYNSNISNNISLAVGDPTLYKPQQISLLNKYQAGDEVVLRFKLFSDQLAAGWGWAIDNLKIQVDDTPPVVLNNHVDYLRDDATLFSIITNATDVSGIKDLKIEYTIDNGAVQEVNFDVDPVYESYIFSIDAAGGEPFPVGTQFTYRIIATDSADNVGYFPPDASFLKVPVVDFQNPVATYSNNFNSSTSDFVGNFFNISQPAGFTDGAIHSTHFYPTGLGLDKKSNFTFTLLKPITVSSTNSYIRFDEIALVEGHAAGAVFGNANFKDYVVVEGSKDGGVTWSPLLPGYDIIAQSDWIGAFSTKSNGTPSLYKKRAFDIRSNGNFQSGDDVLIRFRLYTDELVNGWGWAIDNLYIQDPITNAEGDLQAHLSIYPNPTRDHLTIKTQKLSSSGIHLQLMNIHGQTFYESTETVSENFEHTISLKTLPKGLYLLKVSDGNNYAIKKIVKVD